MTAIHQLGQINHADLMRMIAEDLRVEIYNGEIVPMSPTGVLHGIIVTNFVLLLKPYVRKHKLGQIFGDGVIHVLREDEEGIQDTRVPDVAFVRQARFTEDYDISRPFPGAPDLAVEVVSPSESAESLLSKVKDYLAEGTEQVWVVYPRQKEIHVHEKGREEVRIYKENDVLEASSLFPDLKIAVAECFSLD